MDLFRHLLLASLFAVIVGLSPSAMAETLKFSCIEGTPDAEISRLVLAEAYGRLGIDIIINKFPGLRALTYANEGTTDGELFRAKGADAEYPNLIQIQIPISTVEAVVITEDFYFDVSGWQSLKPYLVGIQAGVTFIESGIAQVEGLIVYRVKDSSQLFGMLEKKRINVAVLPKIIAVKALAGLQNKDITILDPPLQRLSLYHYLNKKHAQLVPDLEAVLKSMQDEGEIKRIRKDFISTIISY